MKDETKALSTVNRSYEESIPAEYRNTPEHPLPLGDFAEKVTTETLKYFLIRLATESKDKGRQVSCIRTVAETLDVDPKEIEREFRECQNTGSNGREGFRFLSVGELYSMSSATDWLIKSYLDKGSLAELFGKSGTFKSFVAIDMGLSIATGTDWHGNPVGQGTVFYICGEGQKGVARRLRAWELHHEIGLAEIPFFVSNRAAQFLDDESALDVVEAVNKLREQHGDPVLVIVDTLNRNFGPGDESNTSDMTQFVSAVDTSLRIPFGCTVLIIHHTGHKETDRARGSYSLYAALDWEYKSVIRDKILELTNTKSKDFELLPPVYLKPEIITLDWQEEDGEAMTSLVLTSTAEKPVKKNKHDKPLTGANKIAYDALLQGITENGGKPLHEDTWRSAAYKAGISTSDKPDTKQKAFGRAKDDLHGRGLIETKDDHWRPTQQDTGHGEDI
jgi:hypothetical protein